MKSHLPSNPNLDYLKLRAKTLLKRFREGDQETIKRVRESHPRFASFDREDANIELVLRDAQLVVAREYGFSTWAHLKQHVEGIRKRKAASKGGNQDKIMKAARAGKAEVVFELLDREPELMNAATYHNDTPLMMALYRGREELACELVRRGADPFAETMEPDWPVALAVRKSMTSFLETVSETQKSVPELFKKVWLGSARDVAEELRKDSTALEVFLPDSFCGMTPLFYAVIRGQIDVVKVLIEGGANVNAGNSENNLYNPLLSSLEQDLEITRLLLDAGADTTGIIMPFRKVSAKVVRLFAKLGQCGSPLVAALYERNKRKVSKLLATSPELADDRCPNGFPTLVLAVELQDAEIIAKMVDAGAAIDARIENPVLKDLKGTALEYAADRGLADIVKLLIDRGASTDSNNHSAINAAIWQFGYGYKYVRKPDYRTVIRLLRENGSPVGGLRHAVEAGATEKIEFLIDQGADVNEIDENGYTPLDYCTGVASNWGREAQFHEQVAELLIAHGARHSEELKKPAGAPAL